MTGMVCGDNRFKLIEKYKNKLIESTNIETAKDEMAVIDSILFRFWQMGWLGKLEDSDRQKVEIEDLQKAGKEAVSCFTRMETLYKIKCKELEIAKSEAIKEFAEQVQEEIANALRNNYEVRGKRAQEIPIYTDSEFFSYCSGKIDCLRGLCDFIDNLVKEMEGESK